MWTKKLEGREVTFSGRKGGDLVRADEQAIIQDRYSPARSEVLTTESRQ